MNADDEKNINDLFDQLSIANKEVLRNVFALGRRAGMTEAAGICMKHSYAHKNAKLLGPELNSMECAAAIEKARDA